MGEQFNIGSDTRITILKNGLPVAAAILTSFEAKQLTTRVTSKKIDGKTNSRELPEGWDLDFEFDRGNSQIDDLFVAEEELRYAGQPPSKFTVVERTSNPDGTVSRYRYEEVVLKLDTAGDRKGDGKVTQKMSGFASRRRAA